jgi:hypothetical protein
MNTVVDNPFIVSAVALLMQSLAACFGDYLRKRVRTPSEDERHNFDTIQTASLTLLALIIGFSFSMAVTRYDQRKNLEEAEANAIGTEYVRAELLPTADAARTRDLLSRYIAQRILHYQARDEARVRQINAETERLQAELWASVLSAAKAEPTIMVSLAVSGMNDVLNSQGYTQAAWWNRIPIAAWVLMVLMALFCNLLIGYSEHRKGPILLFLLPIIVSISFLLIADIDSPRGGAIHVSPQNLLATSQSMKPM